MDTETKLILDELIEKMNNITASQAVVCRLLLEAGIVSEANLLQMLRHAEREVDQIASGVRGMPDDCGDGVPAADRPVSGQ